MGNFLDLDEIKKNLGSANPKLRSRWLAEFAIDFLNPATFTLSCTQLLLYFLKCICFLLHETLEFENELFNLQRLHCTAKEANIDIFFI